MGVRLGIRWESINDESGEVEIPREKYRELVERYGIYGFDWYFVSKTVVKYWDGRTWNYEHWAWRGELDE